jgi:3-methyladenine DNA glycosylase AlkC
VSKGYSKIADIPKDYVQKLSEGLIESRTLIESLAVKQELLFQKVTGFDFPTGLDSLTITNAMKVIGQWGLENSDISKHWKNHFSDTVRGWDCFRIGLQEITLKEKILKIQDHANDDHFGVREWAWLGLRNSLISKLEIGISELSEWAREGTTFEQRFASEITRPRGVWCTHIKQLIEQPELGEEIILPLLLHSEKYVQDSVANWLNDASKKRPEWVLSILNNNEVSDYIRKRATRNIHSGSNVQ